MGARSSMCGFDLNRNLPLWFREYLAENKKSRPGNTPRRLFLFIGWRNESLILLIPDLCYLTLLHAQLCFHQVADIQRLISIEQYPLLKDEGIAIFFRYGLDCGIDVVVDRFEFVIALFL